jgi:hypothetical protein
LRGEIRHPKRLLVEGLNDLHSVVSIMGEFVNWPKPKDQTPVGIEDMGSWDQVLDVEAISVRLKNPEVQILGLIFDANDSLAARYRSFREICQGFDIPEQIPPDGLVVSSSEKRLGLWIMPDNRSEGYLETFLRGLVPPQSRALWQHAVASTDTAASDLLKAPFKKQDTDKAYFYSWLAWQDAPGRPPGETIRKGHLDARAASAVAFVEWFLRLYQLEPKPVPGTMHH